MLFNEGFFGYILELDLVSENLVVILGQPKITNMAPVAKLLNMDDASQLLIPLNVG